MKFYILLIILMGTLVCNLTADTPGMAVMKVKLISNNDTEEIAFISITWEDRLKVGKIKDLNSTVDLLDYLTPNEHDHLREITTKVYNFQNLENHYVDNYHYDFPTQVVEKLKDRTRFSTRSDFSSIEETDNLDVSQYKSILFLEWAYYLGDCAGIKKLSLKAITLLQKKKITNIINFNQECHTVFLFNLGKLELEQLKILGQAYLEPVDRIEITGDSSFSNKIQELNKSIENLDYKIYRQELIQISLDYGVIIFHNQSD